TGPRVRRLSRRRRSGRARRGSSALPGQRGRGSAHSFRGAGGTRYSTVFGVVVGGNSYGSDRRNATRACRSAGRGGLVLPCLSSLLHVVSTSIRVLALPWCRYGPVR